MMTDKKRLPDAELAVMQAIWEKNKEVGRSDLDDALCSHNWNANTVNTYLTRLCEKGYLSVRREGKNNLYTPLVAKDEYLKYDSRETLQKLYGGKLTSFVAALTAEQPLSENDIEELKCYLDEMSR